MVFRFVILVIFFISCPVKVNNEKFVHHGDDPCGPLPSCPAPPPGTCIKFTYEVIMGVKCITGCTYYTCDNIQNGILEE